MKQGVFKVYPFGTTCPLFKIQFNLAIGWVRALKLILSDDSREVTILSVSVAVLRGSKNRVPCIVKVCHCLLHMSTFQLLHSAIKQSVGVFWRAKNRVSWLSENLASLSARVQRSWHRMTVTLIRERCCTIVDDNCCNHPYYCWWKLLPNTALW